MFRSRCKPAERREPPKRYESSNLLRNDVELRDNAMTPFIFEAAGVSIDAIPEPVVEGHGHDNQ